MQYSSSPEKPARTHPILQPAPTDFDETTLHLCNTPGQLLTSICDEVYRANTGATIIYLNDEVPLTEPFLSRLSDLFPKLKLIQMSDYDVMQQFVNLPSWLPSILRRNIRFDRKKGFVRPMSWRPDYLKNKVFTKAYIYNTGFFMAKVLTGPSHKIILRESGLNNYASSSTTFGKSLIRLLFGLSPRYRTAGEERWVDLLEMSRPQDLPAKIRAKAVQYDATKMMLSLDPEDAERVIELFNPAFPILNAHTKTVLILTQPLDRIGFCSEREKIKLYGRIADYLRSRGYNVFVRNHPREREFELPETTPLMAEAPIELWSLTGHKPFDLAVALCSATIAQTKTAFCKRSIQLVDVENFQVSQYAQWSPGILRPLHDLK